MLMGFGDPNTHCFKAPQYMKPPQMRKHRMCRCAKLPQAFPAKYIPFPVNNSSIIDYSNINVYTSLALPIGWNDLVFQIVDVLKSKIYI